jgi:hypothetical protein
MNIAKIAMYIYIYIIWSINRFVLVMVTRCVFWPVGTKFLYSLVDFQASSQL